MTTFLETKRLILKKPTTSDFEVLCELRSDPEVMKYIGTGETQTKEQVKEFIDLIEPYQDKYGLSFYSVFEKETGHFVGQAGLFHLGFDINQKDIELAYRLHKKYWNKGYATELAKALIKWSFEQYSLKKIVAIVHPENERSRKVMEKSGMSYHGLINLHGKEIPCYEIYKNHIDYKKIELVPISLDDYPTLINMAYLYAYDISEFFAQDPEWKISQNGLYEPIDFKKYWRDKNSFPFFIYYDGELAGFVIVDKKGSESQTDFNMAQFFIYRKFKNKGVGRYVAHCLFDQFPGSWEVMVIPGNEGAYRFWRSIIRDYTHHQFTETTRRVTHFNNSLKNIFKLSSNKDAK